MIQLLKSKGYRLTSKETLGNREFSEGQQSFSINEDFSSFGKRAYDLTQTFELFLDEKHYRIALMESIIDETRASGIDDVEFSVIKEERGYMVTFTTITEGVK